jgi:hypothetical protein
MMFFRFILFGVAMQLARSPLTIFLVGMGSGMYLEFSIPGLTAAGVAWVQGKLITWTAGVLSGFWY